MKRVFGVLVITILALSVIPIGFGQSGFTYPPNYDPEKGDDLNFDLNDYYYDVYTNTMKDLKCYRSCKSENGQCIDNCQKAEENNKVICDKIESDCTDLYSGDNWDADEYNMCLKANGYNDCTERTVLA
jgi:hypothetical protein